MFLEEPFYHQAVRCLPIVCVDLLITNKEGLILLVKRVNPPADGHWWFPGGRTLFRESRDEAVPRKLMQECGLQTSGFKAVGTYDIVMDRAPDGSTAHSVTTLYHVTAKDGEVKLDSQSSDFAWKSAREWMSVTPFDWLKQRISEWDATRS